MDPVRVRFFSVRSGPGFILVRSRFQNPLWISNSGYQLFSLGLGASLSTLGVLLALGQLKTIQQSISELWFMFLNQFPCNVYSKGTLRGDGTVTVVFLHFLVAAKPALQVGIEGWVFEYPSLLDERNLLFDCASRL